MRKMWLIPLIAVVAIAAFCIWWFRYDTYHFAAVADGVLYRDGVRSQRTFENTARRARFKTIVRLIDLNEQQTEPFIGEAAWCKANGVEIIEIPIRLGGWPTAEQVSRFLSVAADRSHQPVLLHCAQGVRRTGMMVAAYQESVQGFDKDRAKSAILRFGHSDRSIGDVKKFIDLYDPTTKAVPENLPMGKEGSAGTPNFVE